MDILVSRTLYMSCQAGPGIEPGPSARGAVYVDLKCDDVLNFVCERVDGGLLMMGCCVGCAWRCCYELCGCVNGASPVEFVLSSFYLCAFQMNPVCGYI